MHHVVPSSGDARTGGGGAAAVIQDTAGTHQVPRALETYPSAGTESLAAELTARVRIEPFNALATGIFLVAILHTFMAPRFARLAHRVQQGRDERARARSPSLRAEALHFLGEVEVVFGLWAVVLLAAIAAYTGWETAKHYLNDTVNYTEPLFVVVIMALASTRPVVGFAERALRPRGRRRRRHAGRVVGDDPDHRSAARLVHHRTGGDDDLRAAARAPVLRSATQSHAPQVRDARAAVRQRLDRRHADAFRRAAGADGGAPVGVGHAVHAATLRLARGRSRSSCRRWSYFVVFRRELQALAARPAGRRRGAARRGRGRARRCCRFRRGSTAVHVAFMAWTVVNAHYPALFVGGFLFFLGFARATAPTRARRAARRRCSSASSSPAWSSMAGCRAGGLRRCSASLSELPLFVGATVLTAFNDNALITYLATLVPEPRHELKLAVVQGAVTGGGLTVIANAPNPAGQALLGAFLRRRDLSARAARRGLVPTLIAVVIFRVL